MIRIRPLLTALALATTAANLLLARPVLAKDYVVDVRGDKETGYTGIIIDRETGEAVDYTPKVRKRKAKALKDAHDTAEELEEESGGDGVVDDCFHQPEICFGI